MGDIYARQCLEKSHKGGASDLRDGTLRRAAAAIRSKLRQTRGGRAGVFVAMEPPGARSKSVQEEWK